MISKNFNLNIKNTKNKKYSLIYHKNVNFNKLKKQVLFGNKTDLSSCILWQSASKTVLNSSSVVLAVQVSIQCLITLKIRKNIFWNIILQKNF